MEALNFRITDNKDEVIAHLESKGYRRIGHEKYDLVGFCILIKRKEFFGLSGIMHPHIKETSNFSDLTFYCT